MEGLPLKQAKPRRGRPPRSAGRRDTRRAAIDAAQALLISGGDGELSMERVARALGVQTPSLYHHFPGGRDEMILAVADECSRVDGEAIDAIVAAGDDPVVRLNAIASRFAEIAGRHPYHMLTELRKRLSPAARVELQRLFAERVEMPILLLVREAQAAGAFRQLEAEMVVRAFLALMLSLGDFEANDPQRAMLPTFLVDLIAHGLCTPTG